MIKRQLMAMATFTLSSITAFAACTDNITTQAARMTTSVAGPNEDIELLKSAFSLLREAKVLCEQGNESEATKVLNKVNSLLTDMGR